MIERISGLRQTEQRTLILEELRLCARDGYHPGADEVYLRVRKRLPRISLATVYRNLQLLAARGLIGRLEIAGGHNRFDGVVRPHCHFRCTSCGQVEDLPFDVPLPQLDPEHPWVHARRIEGRRTEYYGLCPGCVHASQDSGTNGRVTP
jgi:Fur family ferric uptake transcriptional regulator